MPRGWKYAVTETNDAFDAGTLTNPRSFIGFHADKPNEFHELLYGKDKSKRRLEIYERAQGYCQGCAIPHRVFWEDGEWHHDWNMQRPRCDCLHSGQWVCGAFHRKQHVQVKLKSIPGIRGLER